MRRSVGCWTRREGDDADKAEIRNLARRLELEWPGVTASVFEGSTIS